MINKKGSDVRIINLSNQDRAQNPTIVKTMDLDNHPFDKNAKGCLHVNLESIAVNFIREKRKVMMVSVISEIGVATVNYDMRRLSEILAFPKAANSCAADEELKEGYLVRDGFE